MYLQPLGGHDIVVECEKETRKLPQLLVSSSLSMRVRVLFLTAPTCAGSEEGSNHFGSYIHNISLYFCKRLFLGLEPMISWLQGNSFTIAPGLPFKQFAQLKTTKWKELAFHYVNKLKKCQIDSREVVESRQK
jgi:hypothetical protein